MKKTRPYFPLLVATLLTAGCVTSPVEIGPVDSRTVGCSLEIGSKNSAGTPTRIRVTYRNQSREDVTIALPGPLCGESDAPPAAFIGIRLTNPTNAEEEFVFVLPDAKDNIPVETRRLKPGMTCAASYDLDTFYRYGPCGPDRWGSFVKYFDRGQTTITMRAMWIPDVKKGETNIVESNTQTFSGSYQDWLFNK